MKPGYYWEKVDGQDVYYPMLYHDNEWCEVVVKEPQDTEQEAIDRAKELIDEDTEI